MTLKNWESVSFIIGSLTGKKVFITGGFRLTYIFTLSLDPETQFNTGVASTPVTLTIIKSPAEPPSVIFVVAGSSAGTTML